MWMEETNSILSSDLQVNGESNVEFPQEQPMSAYHTLLFRLARKSMNNYLKNKEQKGKAKGDLVLKDKANANDGPISEENYGRSGANIDLKDAM